MGQLGIIGNSEQKQAQNIQNKTESVLESKNLCPRCKEGILVTRTNKNSGQAFMGCSNYPNCKYTQNVKPITQNTKGR